MDLKRYPMPVLRKKCKPVRQINDDVARRAREMLEFMYESEGLGLAACQVGWTSRVVTLDVEGEHKGRRIFVNPLIVRREGQTEEEEGCLSLPGVRVNLARAEKVSVVAYALSGERVELEAEGLAARAWQHELDHLNGLLIIDRLLPTSLIAVRDQLKKLEEEGAAEQA